VLLNADYLTIEGQSALRRCIELFSKNTRFFIVVENKNKLLNPILSRFCEMYVPDDTQNNMSIYQYIMEKTLPPCPINKNTIVFNMMKRFPEEPNPGHCVEMAEAMVEAGLSALDFMDFVGSSSSSATEQQFYFHTIRAEHRCEKMLLFILLVKYFDQIQN